MVIVHKSSRTQPRPFSVLFETSDQTESPRKTEVLGINRHNLCLCLPFHKTIRQYIKKTRSHTTTLHFGRSSHISHEVAPPYLGGRGG